MNWMDLSGLSTPFPCHRPLSEREKRDQLRQHERINGRPRPHLSVIRMNSTYLESADIWFGERGLGTSITTVLLVMCVPLVLLLPTIWLQALGLMPSTEERALLITIGLVGPLLLFPFIWGLVWLLRKDAFAYTHYPMRFHRISRLVYVFRTNGTVLTVPWDDLFVTLGYGTRGGTTFGEVRAHVLDAAREMVLETFGLSHSTPKSSDGPVLKSGEAVHPDTIYAQWEFIRRYMEEGPHAVIDEVQQCLSIDRERESAVFSFSFLANRWSGGNAVLRALAFPFVLVWMPFRIITMRTSKVPRWPREVEAACVIEDGDPYAIEGTAAGHLITLYPEAARPAYAEAGALEAGPGQHPTHPTSSLPEAAPGAFHIHAPGTAAARKTRGRSSNQKRKWTQGK
ncbi:DUF6708 domain-containing protein [Deinococcus hohokamensis]|uniref:DUF6708 domain-containing protein n=1 Tax=Deinococcus hohokamensis TaxID=309883 RepID=A0ABV9IFJ5_9DEIO